jgi:hypothetical protein
VTAILSYWKRPHNLRAQVSALRGQSAPPAEIWLWADTCDENRSYSYDDVEVDRAFRNSSNLGVYGRFAVALLARSQYVAIFDDDTIPGRRYLEACLAAIREQPGIYSAAGVQFLSAESYRPCLRYGWAQRTSTTTRVDVGCHSWLLQRDWLGYLWREPPFDWSNGEDMRLSYLCQKYGGLPTYVAAQDCDETSGSLLGTELGSGPEALSLTTEHYRLRTLQLIDQLKNGWQTIREIEKPHR